jgi:hypothetical protein
MIPWRFTYLCWNIPNSATRLGEAQVRVVFSVNGILHVSSNDPLFRDIWADESRRRDSHEDVKKRELILAVGQLFPDVIDPALDASPVSLVAVDRVDR